jgi:hypothetical protein
VQRNDQLDLDKNCIAGNRHGLIGNPVGQTDGQGKSVAKSARWVRAKVRSNQRRVSMTPKPISRIVMSLLVLVGACDVRREPPVETKAATAAPAALPVAGGDERSGGLATAQAGANAEKLAASPGSADTNNFVPVFDIARIERTGDAVIAGRAAPGAIVELLRNSEPLDRAVADQSGQFVMVTPRLAPGDHELTLRSRQPDGKQTTSEQSVVVAIEGVKVSPDVLNSRAELASPRAECAARFAAVSLTNDQGARAIVSNVLVPADANRVTPCQVQVSFFGADGSLIGNATTLQLKAGESTSVTALRPSNLVRAVVSIGDVVDSAKLCLLRTRIEIFDLQTGTTFVSVSGDSVGSECNASVGSGTTRRAPKPRSHELATTPPHASR